MEAKTIQEKLVNIQAGLKAPKGQLNKFGNYNYRSCEDIMEAVKPLLAEAELLLLMRDEIVLVGDRYYVKAEAILSSGVETENGWKSIRVWAFAREAETKKGMDVSQITGAASSYARKYALNGLFAIDDTEDADTQKNSNSTVKPKPTETKKPEPKIGKPSKSSLAILNKAYEEYIMSFAEELIENFIYDKEMFYAAVFDTFKKWPSREDSIKMILEKVSPIDCMKDLGNEDVPNS